MSKKKPTATPSSTGRFIVMNEHNGWGNAVSWWKTADLSTDTNGKTNGHGKVHGHLPHPKPVVGDVFIAEMKSGRKAGFIATAVETFTDPPDQFFADVEFIGYRMPA